MISLKSSSSTSSSLNSDFHGHRFLVQELEGIPKKGNIQYCSFSLNAQMKTGIIGETQKWWEKGLQPNMKEVKGAQDLVESLFNAGDTLVVVDFFSPGCGGCKALHPKICQLAEMNPEVQFLQVNYEEHKSMCYSLNVRVLPFFRFYRGAHGRLCSFSCTNATIKKFKDALAKHSQNYCSLGPPKGLEKKELIALAANKDLSFNYTPKPEQPTSVPPTLEEILAETAQTPPSHSEAEPSVSPPLPLPLPLPLATGSNAAKGTEDKTLVASGSRLRRMRMASQIKKFKDALAKHSQNCCSLGPPKGLEKKELIALAANKDLSFNYKPKPEQLTPVPPTLEEILAETAPTLPSHSEVEPSVSPPLPLPIPLATSSNAAKGIEDKTLVASGRRLRRMRTFFSRAMHCLAISSCTD
ncbi:thioredoxin-like 1-1, chloroplastic isoform X1 [Camellia sinensis]|uniref:Thioredoxin domain-containing protein n=1 Tax=Camellia sinensis var. sinensis TaxID=542762 RepID=A0A4S4EWN7_CAMSN|nr:thioredoxin-like 1-1, chloroplastic isoform X1 [Camellia sinensis]THG21428.1 hypothetical protein TEA_001046 [Camellia sinensis var. sinensis]